MGPGRVVNYQSRLPKSSCCERGSSVRPHPCGQRLFANGRAGWAWIRVHLSTGSTGSWGGGVPSPEILISLACGETQAWGIFKIFLQVGKQGQELRPPQIALCPQQQQQWRKGLGSSLGPGRGPSWARCFQRRSLWGGGEGEDKRILPEVRPPLPRHWLGCSPVLFPHSTAAELRQQ